MKIKKLVFAMAIQLAVFPLAAGAAAVVDQSFTNPDTAGPLINECCSPIGQTFMAGLDGTLAGINIYVESESVFPLRVRIFGTTDGMPNSTVLGETTLTTSDAPIDRLITFPQLIGISAGTQYAILADYPSGPPAGYQQFQGAWHGAGGDLYAGGAMWALEGQTWKQVSDIDTHFRTYVEPVPEPSIYALLIAGGLLASATRKCRQRVGGEGEGKS
jgi:hypothetical protein